MIEDHSARIKILKNTDKSSPLCSANFVTGTVVALKGKMDPNGLFEVTDFTYPGVPCIESMPKDYEQLVNMKDNEAPRSIYEDLENREFVAFVSGIEFGNNKEKATIELIARWLMGQFGTNNDRLLSSRISRFIVGGNSIGEENDIDEVVKGSFRTHELNERVYSNISNSIEQFESFLTKISENCNVDIMPGNKDISGSFLPQQPLNVALFPELLKNDNIIFSTNPHQFNMNGLNFLGTSGQNIEDI